MYYSAVALEREYQPATEAGQLTNRCREVFGTGDELLLAVGSALRRA